VISTKQRVLIGAATLVAVGGIGGGYKATTGCGCNTPVYGVADVTPPGVALLTPVPTSTVQGASVQLSATASDNVGVVSVQFAIDGINVGSPDTTAPYSVTWDSTSVTDGTHTVSVTAVDAANNSGFAGPFPIIVSNAATIAPATFRIFVAPGAGGNDADATNCKWFSPAVAAPPGGSGTGCSTFQKALTLATANSAATAGADVAVYGSATKYTNGKWDLCVSWVASCDTMDTATNTIKFWKDPASSATPVVQTQQQIEGSHFDMEGPFFSDLSLCTGVTTAGNFEPTTDCPQLVIGTNTGGGTHPVEHDVTVNNYDNFSRFYITSGHDITVKNSDFGPSYDWHGIVHCKTVCTTQGDRPGNIIINNVAVHDQQNSSGCTGSCVGSHHVGCGPTFNDAYNVLINASKFYNCEDTGMLLKSAQWQDNDITISNSVFGLSANGLQIDDACTGAGFGCGAANSTWTKKFSNIHLYGDTFDGYGSGAGSAAQVEALSGTANNCSGCEVRGNILRINPAFGGFGTDWTLTDNWATQSVTCGGGATCTNNTQVANTAALGLDTDLLHILPSSALYHALPASPPWLSTTDIDGDPRAVNSSPGADDGGNTPPPDTTPPSVSISAPTDGATVSGASVTISASASDDTGVVGVQFKVDGSNQGSEDTTAPYGITWDTTGLSNATHTITAVARDGFSHSTTSSTVTVTVSNLSTLTGASTATCSGSCSTNTVPAVPPGSTCSPVGTITTGFYYLGNINNGSASECRDFAIDVPVNLNHAGGSPSQSPAAMIIAPGSGSCSIANNIHTTTRWDDESVTGHFILAMLQYPIGCTRTAFLHPATDYPTGTGGSDLPYVEAVVAVLVAAPYNVDPSRIYFDGQSSGGAEAWSIACDNTASALFRGIAATSNTMQEQSSGGAPVTNTENCPGTNKNLFVYMVSGPNDSQASYNPVHIGIAPNDHFVSGFAETRRFWGARLGCGSTPSTTHYGTPSANNIHYQYGGCVFGSPTDQFLATDISPTGGHSAPCQDSEVGVTANQCAGSTPNTNGQWDAKDIWDFFSTRQWLG
jgi:poly(3-hydroxybutyrate) depolymerase